MTSDQGEARNSPAAAGRGPFVYIMARPHSGSTMLAALLGNSEHLEGVGEIILGLARPGPVQCSCGMNRAECPYWRQVRARVEREGDMPWSRVVETQYRQARFTRLPATLLASGAAPWVRECRLAAAALADAVRDVSGKAGVVEATKERARALFLGRFVPEARVIHLLRHPGGVVNSYYWRNRRYGTFWIMRRFIRVPRALFPLCVLWVALTWNLDLAAALIIGRIVGSKFMRLRYEDLCADPRAALERAGDFISVDMAPVIGSVREGKELAIGHIIAGNQMRHGRKFQLDGSIGDWRSRLPLPYRVLTLLLTWPFLLLAGYGGGRAPQSCSARSG